MARSGSSRKRSRITLMTATAMVALVSAGCGGSSGLSKQELAKKANAVCKPHFERTVAAAQKVLAGGRLPTPQQFGQLAMGTIIPEYAAQIKQLRELKPSKDVKPAYEKWLADSDATRAKMQENPAVIQNGATFASVNAQAGKLGLSKQCYVGPTT